MTKKERKVVAKARVVNAGDLLISNNVLATSKIENGIYNFENIFKDIEKYVKSADYGVVNLETSLGGDKMEYCGFPRFNTPDSIVEAAKKTGFNMFLTASNHSYDLGYDALIRRIEVLEKNKVDYIGTRKHEKEKFHKIIEVNNIKIGMLNYTKETSYSSKDKIILNSTRNLDSQEKTREYIEVDEEGKKLISTYNGKYKKDFYKAVKKDIKSLRKEGAEILVAYMHWGIEYKININNTEDQIAQKLCDLGIDVIVGGHPHVIEPIKVYTSKKSKKTTACIHSLGNFVSGMRRTLKKENADYIEDGILFGYTVKKYNNGTVEVDNIDILPTWVYKDENKQHTIIPLDKEHKHEHYNEESYNRTMELVEKGMKEFNEIIKK